MSQRGRGVAVEAVIMVGLQGSGKSTFCKERFCATHLRLNLDMLKSRHRERQLLAVCVDTNLRFVVDNTNPTRAERAVYIEAVRRVKMRVVGYVFTDPLADCLRRNDQRPEAQRIPYRGVMATHARYEPPSLSEGFDALFTVTTDGTGGFTVGEWPAEA